MKENNKAATIKLQTSNTKSILATIQCFVVTDLGKFKNIPNAIEVQITFDESYLTNYATPNSRVNQDLTVLLDLPVLVKFNRTRLWIS